MSQPKRAGARTPHQHISLEAVRVLFGRRTISFRPEFAALGIGTKYGPLGAKGALFLSQAFYWAESTRDPAGWFTKTQKEIFAVTGLSEDEQFTVRAELRRRGYLVEDTFGIEVTDQRGHTFIGPGRLHYRLGLEPIHEHLEIQVTAYPNWVTTGDTTPEDAAERRKRRNEADRARRKKAKQARQELARLGESGERESDETPVRVSEKTGYAFSEEENAAFDEMRIRENRKHVPDESADTHPEQSESHYIELSLLEEEAREQQQYGALEDFADAQSGSVVVVEEDLKNNEPTAQTQASDPGEQRAERVFKELAEIGLDADFIRWAIGATIKGRPGLDVCERQLEFWPFQGDDKGAGFLRRAIENDWNPPAAYTKHKAAQAAQRQADEQAQKAAQEAQKAAAQRAAQEEDKEAENRRARELHHYWQEVWASLTDDERDLVVLCGLKLADDTGSSFVRDRYNKTARANEKSGDNGGKGLLPIEWRNKAIAFMLEQGELDAPQQGAPVGPPPAPAPAAPGQAPTSAEDAMLDNLFDHLDAVTKGRIEGNLKAFKEAPQTPVNQAAYLKARRAHVRELFNQLAGGENAPAAPVIEPMPHISQNGTGTRRRQTA